VYVYKYERTLYGTVKYGATNKMYPVEFARAVRVVLFAYHFSGLDGHRLHRSPTHHSQAPSVPAGEKSAADTGPFQSV
jgi:hypothetical protein